MILSISARVGNRLSFSASACTTRCGWVWNTAPSSGNSCLTSTASAQSEIETNTNVTFAHLTTTLVLFICKISFCWNEQTTNWFSKLGLVSENLRNYSRLKVQSSPVGANQPGYFSISIFVAIWCPYWFAHLFPHIVGTSQVSSTRQDSLTATYASCLDGVFRFAVLTLTYGYFKKRCQQSGSLEPFVNRRFSTNEPWLIAYTLIAFFFI